MKTKRKVEPAPDGSGYCLTENGRTTWSLIRQGSKFREAIFLQRASADCPSNSLAF